MSAAIVPEALNFREVTEWQTGNCPDARTLGPGVIKKKKMEGGYEKRVTVYPACGMVIKEEYQRRIPTQKLCTMYNRMLQEADHTRAAVFGVKALKIKEMFLIITWTEYLPGDVASRGCITPAEAATLFQEISESAKWFGKHGDLHQSNVHFWRCSGACQEPCQGVCQPSSQGQGNPVLRVFDFGLPFIDSDNEGDIRAFDKETAQYVSFLLSFFLIGFLILSPNCSVDGGTARR